ncbi:hypothetical protein A33M_1138 [Rhodovulum sp. PH10]|nr:hypothetical protein A33M_1138 [Rhodovulum sp. PH10]
MLVATRRIDRVVIGAVALVAIGFAASMLVAHVADPDSLWTGVLHDRNGHFGFAVDLAVALRSLDPVGFLSQLAKSVVWPPLHGLLLSGVLVVGGLDVRLGIVPSLIGWTATVVLSAVLARRMFPDPTRGSVAAVTAAALALASPAFALLGSDVMLEGLGAALSALALLAFARAVEADEPRNRAPGEPVPSGWSAGKPQFFPTGESPFDRSPVGTPPVGTSAVGSPLGDSLSARAGSLSLGSTRGGSPHIVSTRTGSARPAPTASDPAVSASIISPEVPATPAVSVPAAADATSRWWHDVAVRRWRALALVLTLLFFHKGNYWGLVVMSLAVSAAIEHRDALSRAVSALRIDMRFGRSRAAVSEAARAILRDPLVIASLVVLVLVAAIYRHGPADIVVGGRAVSLYPPENLVTVAYALLFVRLAIAWRRHRKHLAPMLGVPGRAIFTWHVVPVAVSFLIPKRLPGFLWFVGPANSPTHTFDPLGGAAFYWDAFAGAFHPSPAIAVAVVALFLVGLVGATKCPPGSRAVFVLAVLASFAVLVHPHHQGRFLASWIFAWWVGAGAGAGVVVGLIVRSPAIRAKPMAAVSAVGLLAVSVGLGILVGLVPARPSPETVAAAGAVAGRDETAPSEFLLVRSAIPLVADARTVGFATTFGPAGFFTWMLRAHCACAVRVDGPWLAPRATREDDRRAMAAYLAATSAERLVVVDAPDGAAGFPPSPDRAFPHAATVGILDALAAQQKFAEMARFAVPEHGATLTVWARRADETRRRVGDAAGGGASGRRSFGARRRCETRRLPGGHGRLGIGCDGGRADRCGIAPGAAVTREVPAHPAGRLGARCSAPDARRPMLVAQEACAGCGVARRACGCGVNRGARGVARAPRRGEKPAAVRHSPRCPRAGVLDSPRPHR